MENLPSESELRNLVKELSQGRELAKQLQFHLHNAQSSSNSHENRELLIQRILHSYDQALSLITTHARPGGGGGEVPPPPAMSDSPRSLAGSPHSDDSDQDFKDHQAAPSRKRNKAVTKWSQKIKVCSEAGIEGQLDDGYGWRKYGQKDILGAKYPRGYYRCTYRHSQGCMAAKQVQRSDDDPTIFEITYRRQHTCNPTRANTTNNSVNNPPAPLADPQNEDPNPLTQNPPIIEPLLFNIQTSLRVITPDLAANENSSFPPFNFPSSSAVNPGNNHIFSDGNNILGNYHPISTNDMNDNINYGGVIPNVNNSDSELSPIVAAMTSATNSPTLGTDFPFGSSGFGSDFSFGNPGYYPN